MWIGSQLRALRWRLYRRFSPTERALSRQEAAHKQWREETERKIAERVAAGEDRARVESDLVFGEDTDALVDYEFERSNQQKRLLYRAGKRSAPPPPSGPPYWEEAETLGGSPLLTYEGVYKLKSDLRKDRQQSWDLTLKIAMVLTGLVGTLIGLVSVLKGCRS
jgi:hypothetical protein